MEPQTNRPPFKGDGLYVPADPEITYFNTGHYVQRATINRSLIFVEDPGVGDFAITSPLQYDLRTTATAMRAGNISQLCKNKEDSTIPNLADLEREECLRAHHPIVEKFGAEQGLSRDHIDAILIAISYDDEGHTALSHTLEQAIQKWAGPENYHQLVWPQTAEYGGTQFVLKKWGIPVDETLRVKGFEIPPWADRGDNKTDLDVDNLQYIIAEGLRTFETDLSDPAVREKVRNAVSLDNFEITPDGRMAVKDPETALVISKMLMLFSTEHWNDPINRAHMHLLIHGVQRSVTKRRLPWMDDIDCGQTRDPIGYYFGVDQDFKQAMTTGSGTQDNFVYIVGNTLNSSGMEERRRFVDYRVSEYSRFILDDRAENYPSRYLNPVRVNFGPRPSVVETETVTLTEQQKRELDEVKIPRLDDDQDALTYVAGPLKNRSIDPLVRKGDGYVRLSEYGAGIGDSYKKLLQEHAQLQSLGVRVRFAFNPGYAEEFRAGMKENDTEFNERVRNHSEMTFDQRRRIIEQGANTAMALGQASGRLILKRDLSF